MSIEKSPLVRQQEEKIADLQLQIKKKNTSIKSLKTRLQNMQDRIASIQKQAAQAVDRVQGGLLRKAKELKELLEKLSKDRRFSKKERADLKILAEDVAENLADLDIDPEFIPTDFETEDGKAKSHDPFAEFKVAPAADDQKEIRKLYLQLSKRFHPDRAKNEAERKQYHELQQRVINAYQAHDLQELVKMAMEHDLSLLDTAANETDVLEHRIQFLTRQLAALEEQRKRLSAEIKKLRKSKMGEMLTEVDSYAREGIDMMDVGGINLQAAQHVETLLNALKAVDRTGNLDLLNDLPDAPEDDFLFDGGGQDFEAGIADFFSAEARGNPNPRFAEGSRVCFDASNSKGKITTFSGEVVANYIVDGIPVSDLELGVKALKNAPEVVLEESFDEGNLGTLTRLPEAVLRAAEPPAESEAVEREEILRELWYRFALEELPARNRKSIMAVVTTRSGKSHLEKWYAYLKKNLKLPLEAIHEYADKAIFEKEGTTFYQRVKVVKLVLDQEKGGISTQAISEHGERLQLPLFALSPINRKQDRLVNYFKEWFIAYVEYEGAEYGV